MTEKEKMLAGKIYDSCDPELTKLRRNCNKIYLKYNQTTKLDDKKRRKLLNKLGIKMGSNAYFKGPIYFDYGCNTSVGDNFYANSNLTILDVCPVNIGNNVFIGTGVSIVTPIHPLRYQERNPYLSDKGYITDKEYAKPITIEDNCWIASNVTICGGVTIGSGSVIGAGSVVTKSIPSNSLAYGNPAKVVRKITEDDKLSDELYKY